MDLTPAEHGRYPGQSNWHKRDRTAAPEQSQTPAGFPDAPEPGTRNRLRPVEETGPEEWGSFGAGMYLSGAPLKVYPVFRVRRS